MVSRSHSCLVDLDSPWFPQIFHLNFIGFDLHWPASSPYPKSEVYTKSFFIFQHPWCHVYAPITGPKQRIASPETWLTWTLSFPYASTLAWGVSCSTASQTSVKKNPPQLVIHWYFCCSYHPEPQKKSLFRAAASRIPVPEPMAPKKSAMMVSMPQEVPSISGKR